MTKMRISARRAALFFCLAVTIATIGVRAEDPPKNKLVIVKAGYGDLPDGKTIDVTEKVKGMVTKDGLAVDATNDNFTDPVEGTVKKLKVDYEFDGKKNSKTVDENESLKINDKGE